MDEALKREIEAMHRALEAMPDDVPLESDESRCYGCGGHCRPMRCPAQD
jgi:hypothetical protein